MESIPSPPVGMFRLPEGRVPERKSEGAIGFDVYARGIVSETELDENDNRLRKTIFDFRNVPSNASLEEYIVRDPDNKSKWAYELRPGEHVLIGIGFVTSMPNDMMLWLTPRSGLSMKRLTLNNAPGTIDPDYRGEAGALFANESTENFVLQHNMRIAQCIFCPVFLPEFILVNTIDELGDTLRSGGGFGSTGELDDEDKETGAGSPDNVYSTNDEIKNE